MSETKFTKGPWVLEFETYRKGLNHIFARDPADGVRFTVADVFGENHKETQSEMTHANAHLIAAAPRLYEELQFLRNAYAKILTSLDMPPDKSTIVASADAALSAARGEA